MRNIILVASILVVSFSSSNLLAEEKGKREFDMLREAALLKTVEIATDLSEGGIANWTSCLDNFHYPVVFIPRHTEDVLISICVSANESIISVGEVIESFVLVDQCQLEERKQKVKHPLFIWVENRIFFCKEIFKEKGEIKDGKVIFRRKSFKR
mgnify:CR=1 FL=1